MLCFKNTKTTISYKEVISNGRRFLFSKKQQTQIHTMAQAALDREDYAHPEKNYKGLVYSPNGERSVEEVLSSSGVIYNGKDIELCWSCGWTAYDQMTASYGSRIRIIHTNNNVGIWELGHRWLVRDQPNDATLGNDFITQEFLRSQPNLGVPLVERMKKLSAPTDKVDLTLMSRAQGVWLHYGTL